MDEIEQPIKDFLKFEWIQLLFFEIISSKCFTNLKLSYFKIQIILDIFLLKRVGNYFFLHMNQPKKILEGLKAVEADH